MPFDFDSYEKRCKVMTKEQLQKEWENYTRQITAGATGTAASVLLMPCTGGMSAVGLGVSGPRIHNARKKREIIEASLQAQGATPHTRKRDVFTAIGVSGAVSGLTVGIVAPGVADVAVGAAFHHGVEYAATQAALGGSGAVLVHASDQMIRSKDSQAPEPTSMLDYSNIQGEHGESVYDMRPHPSHSWSFDSASMPDKLRTGPIATPFVADASVFRPTLEENEHHNNGTLVGPSVFSEPMNSSTYQTVNNTDAHDDIVRRMELLQVEMHRRQYAQGDSADPGQASNQDNTDPYGTQSGGYVAGNPGPGLGIMGTEQHYSAQYTPPPPPPPLNSQSPQPMYTTKPFPYQRSESLPVTLHSQHETHNYHNSHSHYQYYGEHQQEPLPSYQQHYAAPTHHREPHHHHPQGQNMPTKLPFPNGPSGPSLPDRQDSGYYSTTSTPSITSSSSNNPQQYTPSPRVSSPQQYAQLAHPVRHSAADTGLHRHNHVHRQHRASESAASSLSTSTISPAPTFPPPPPYSQPSITVTTHPPEKESKDYFSMQSIGSVDSAHIQKLAKKKSQAILKGVNQGWQWAKEFPVTGKDTGNSKTKGEAERDYGPPPDIPVPWASS